MAFTLSETVASVALLGSSGYVGRALCSQIQSQTEKLSIELGVGIAVTGESIFCKASDSVNFPGTPSPSC
jgi:homoserine dehydrogenase